MPWCRFFFPKLAASGIKPGDPELNNNIMYAKCIKGHVLKDAGDWICCENLPAPDAQCWQEGGDTIFSLAARQNQKAEETSNQKAQSAEESVRGSTRAQRSRA